MNPKVAIVIVNWNKKDYVLNLLNSLKKINYDNYEIIVVDNASTDGSVEALKELFPEIHLIVNAKNLGGTGGFNTGLKYIMGQPEYEYIWLLDNDVDIDEQSLIELINVMEEDSSIGIAGSRIVDINDKDITVEAGAFFRWDIVGVKPLFRNKRNLSFKKKLIDVDYVAICSALVRTSAVKNVGIMDERYFIFWDDMDWGMQFKKNYYRVVSVLTSIVFHPPFTEKRTPLVDFYYGNRNSLLTYAKHSNFYDRFFIYLKHLRYCLKVLFFLYLNGKKNLAWMGFSAIFDFIKGSWGGKTFEFHEQPHKNKPFKYNNEKIKKIIILNTGNREDILHSSKKAKKIFSEATLTLLIQFDRVDMFKNDFNCIILLKREKLLYLFLIFLKILSKNYDIAILPRYPSPFSYAAKKAYFYDQATDNFIEHNGNRKNIWKLLLSIIAGEITSILFLPVVFIRSIFYKSK